jgi:formylglycine-generating enzyme required for sulfatase activity
MRTTTWVTFCLLLLAALRIQADEPARIALVIGNGAYGNGALRNPVNDAQLLRDTLKADGFAVTYLADADRSQMVRAIQTLGQQLAARGSRAVGLFYFSGHGVQSDGHNFLLPVKASINSDADLLPEAVDAEWVLKQMEQAGNGLDILVLDACRDNPLPRGTKSETRGMGAMAGPPHSVLAFAADSGAVAYDYEDGTHHSPYASALARYMQQPGLELKAMFDAVANSVYESTKSRRPPQIPVQTYKLVPSFYFNPGAVRTSPPSSSQQSAQTSSHSAASTVPPLASLAGAITSPGPSRSEAPKNLAATPRGTVFKDCDACLEMVRVPTGSFSMGSPAGEAGHDNVEGPVHTVTISYPLAVSRYPVTRGQWNQYLQKTGKSGSNNCRGFNQSTGGYEQKPEYSWRNPGFPQEDSHPVVCITWEEARDYAVWLSGQTGHTYRLLSEAEYEYINRAVTHPRPGKAYFWGNDAEDSCRYANGADASAKARFSGWTTLSCEDGYVFTSPVGHFKPNAFDLYDTTGNVYSWVADCWHDSYSEAPRDGSAWTTGGDCGRRAVRGGSWFFTPRALRAALRNSPFGPFFNLGFRLARTSD